MKGITIYAAALLALGGQVLASTTLDRPNVLFILTDDQDWFVHKQSIESANI